MLKEDAPYYVETSLTAAFGKAFKTTTKSIFITLVLFCILISVNVNLAERVSLIISNYSHLITDMGLSLGFFTGVWPKDIYTALLMGCLLSGAIIAVIGLLHMNIIFEFSPIKYGNFFRLKCNGSYSLKALAGRLGLVILAIIFGLIFWLVFILAVPVQVNSVGEAGTYSLIAGFCLPAIVWLCWSLLFLCISDAVNLFNTITFK